MAQDFSSLASLLDHGFDTVIDVRSPSEFAQDHVPGAINLPVLNDAERAEVGTIYVQQSPFLARKIGAAKVFHNAAAHIRNSLQDHDGGWQPLVYCWRGGQRSGSFAWVLQQIGWRAEVISGGYQTYRRLVNDYLYKQPLAHRLILLDGYTGTAKTEILHLLKNRGVQMLDLEGLAEHRGSLLGNLADPQPQQKTFESRIAQALCKLDPTRPVIVEAESSKIGDRIIPPSLWTAMKAAPRIELTADITERARYLVRVYDDVLSDADQLRRKLGVLRLYRGHAIVDDWFELIAADNKTALTRALMEQHYDPAYQKSRKTSYAATLHATSLDGPGLDDVAAKIEQAVTRLDHCGIIRTSAGPSASTPI